MQKIFFWAIIMFCPIVMYPQYTLSGNIVDEEGKPIEFANVVLLNPIDSVFVKGTITNNEGMFRLENIIKGDHEIRISFLGYKTWSRILSVRTDIELATIQMKEDSQTLDKVVINAKKPLIEQKVDRLVFNVGQSIAASGGDAMDALKVAPRIRVRNGEIRMIGKSTVAVMVNGRIQKISGNDLAAFLKTIPSENIENIEIISNPPAKFSAEGNSGLINIVTKRPENDAWNATLRGIYRQATYPLGTIGASYNLQKGNFQMTSSLNYSNGSNAPVETNQIYYPEITWKNVDSRRDFSDALSARLGLEYKINDKLSTGISYMYIGRKPLRKSTERTRLYDAQSGVLDSTFVTFGRSQYNKKIHLLNYHFDYKIDTVGTNLSLDFDFFDYNNQNHRNFNTRTFLDEEETIPNDYIEARNFGIQDIYNYSVNIDMKHPVDWASLNYGGKISFIETDNLFTHYNIENSEEFLNPDLSNRFNYRENTQAVYLSVQKSFLEKWDAKIGFRFEATQTKGYSHTIDQTNNNDYSKLFPTGYLTYRLNDNNTFNLNYGKRINRPGYWLLNPFRWVSNPYSYTEGNPFLQPAFTDNLELSYSYKDKLITNIYYSHTDDDFEQVTIIDSATNIQQIIPKNFIINKTLGINEIFYFKPVKWWNAYASADIYYSSTDSKIPVTLQYLSGWNGEFYLSNNLTLNSRETLFFSISFYHATKGVDNLDYNSSANQLDASLKWLLFDKKVTVNLYANDILSSSRFTYTSYSNNIKNSFRNYYDQRYFQFSILYKFGKNFNTVKAQSKNQEELNRIN